MFTSLEMANSLSMYMLETVKTYIKETPDIPFDDFYQGYIFSIQDQNIQVEVNSVKTNDISSLDKLIARLHKELLGN